MSTSMDNRMKIVYLCELNKELGLKFLKTLPNTMST